MSEGQTLGPDQIGRVRTSHAYDPDTCAFEPDRDDTANSSRAEDCNASAHVTAPKPTAGCRTPCRDRDAATRRDAPPPLVQPSHPPSRRATAWCRTP